MKIMFQIFLGDVEYFELIENVNKCSIKISDKEGEIITIKKEYGIEDSDINDHFGFAWPYVWRRRVKLRFV